MSRFIGNVAKLGMATRGKRRPVLVYDGELSASVEGCGYFDAIIPARKLLGL